MKVLLDECLPKRLKSAFPGHSVSTVPEMGWTGRSNGELLELAKGRFDAFITVDQNLQYQQNLEASKIAVVLLVVSNNRYETFKPLIPKVEQALKTISTGELRRIESSD